MTEVAVNHTERLQTVHSVLKCRTDAESSRKELATDLSEALVAANNSSSTPTPTDTNLLEVITTNRGKPMIIHQGNLYQQRSQYKDGRISYRCSLYHQRTGSCTALLTTDSQHSLVLSQSTHNHPERSPNTLDSKRRTHRLKEMYTGNPTKPVRVAAEELGVTVNQSMRMRCHRIRKRTESDQQ